jgi:hypothetical protein
MILNLVVCVLLRVLDQVQGFHLTQHCLNSCLLLLFNNRYMFRSYDHLQVEIYFLYAVRLTCVNNLELGCFLFYFIFYSITATCFGRMTIFRRKYIFCMLYA